MRTHRQSLHSVYLAAIALSPSVQAQLVIDSLSFGHQQSISPDGHAIPGWHVAGEQNGQPQSPQILSDRVVLTPPAPGHARGALWTDQPIQYPEWSVDMSFRASGPDRASGNLQIWFTKDTAPAAGLRSIYTVESFDGMALVLDQYAGSGGAVRGFLNDGNVNHKNHHNVDGLAFGHCDFSYRNLGRMSKLNMRQGGDGLEVTVDGRTCFRSNMVKLPAGYRFGISAASAETPDSFEVSRFVVSSSNSHSGGSTQYQPPPPSYQGGGHWSGQGSSAPTDQLVNQLNSAQQSIQDLSRELSALSNLQMERHQELRSRLTPVNQAQVDAIDRRIQGIESTVQRIQRDVEGRDYQQTLTSLQNAVRDSQMNLMNTLPQSMSQIVTTSAPRMWVLIAVILSCQALVAGLYLLYKKRIANSPKKLL